MDKLVMGILAHVDAGKTTLSEGLLYACGAIRKWGRVDNKDAFLDTDVQEKERGITIFSKQARFVLGDHEVTLVDTPGHVDFSAEMERTLSILDYAVLVISGPDRVQSHTQTLWRLLKQYQVPVFIFVNKMDRRNEVDAYAIMCELKKRLSDNCVDFSGDMDEIYDMAAMCDEAAMEQYLEEGALSDEMMRELIRTRKLFPCFFGSALKQDKLDVFLVGLNRYMAQKKAPKDFGARVYKIGRDPQGVRLTYMKITGGRLKVKEMIGEEKVNQIRFYNGAKFTTADEALAGDICAVTGPAQTKAGDGLGREKERQAPFLEPILNYRIILPEGTDLHQALQKIRQIEEEEPQLHIIWDEGLGEIHARLMGEIQIEVLKRLVKERFNLDIEFGTGAIAYKETIMEPVEGVGHYEPLKHYAEVHLLMEPLENGSGLVFDSSVPENALDRNWQRLIMTHLMERQHKGVLIGAPITDMKITIVAGRAHLKHTEGGDFRQATYRAVRQGLMKATTVLLEPYYRFSLEVPAAFVGRAMSDLEQMFCQFEITEQTEEMALLTGSGPAACMQTYQKTLAGYSGGKGRLICELEGYSPCHNSEEIWENSGYDPEADLAHSPDSVFCANGAGFVVPWHEVGYYMHLPGLGLESDVCFAGEFTGGWQGDDEEDEPGAASDRRRTGPLDGAAYDKELQAIFRRTYGDSAEKKREARRVRPGFKVREQKEYVYTPAKKQPPKDHYLLVDGYNIIFAWEELKELALADMAAARDKLMEILSDYQGYTKDHLILVFDAYKVEGFKGEVIHWHNIDVVFTKEAETADQYIEKTAHVIGRKYIVTVATSDGTEQVIIRSQGCLSMSARELKEETKRVRKALREEFLDKNPRGGSFLGDYLPADFKPEE